VKIGKLPLTSPTYIYDSSASVESLMKGVVKGGGLQSEHQSWAY
jgi:hypothetical protein